MDVWLEFARGPLFAFCFLVMVLGLARHLILQVYLLLNKGHTLRRVRWSMVALDSLGWAIPLRHLIRGTVVLTLASVLFHIGVIVVPLFLGDHVLLWETTLGFDLPQIGQRTADILTLSTLACLLVLLFYRIWVPRSRALSRWSDYGLIVAIVLPFATGFMAAHPAWNPVPWQAMMLIHVLSANLLLVLVPFSKLAHVVLFPFDRLSQVHWQLKPGAGDKAAAALYGEEARV